jgi:hypothetical protein
LIGEILGRQVNFTQCKRGGKSISGERDREKGNIAITSITRNSMKHVELLRSMASHFFSGEVLVLLALGGLLLGLGGTILE